MRVARWGLIAVLAAGSSLAAGCGEQLEDFRKEELRPLEDKMEAQKAQLAATLRTVQMRDRADARALEAQLVELEKTFAELAKLDPPDDYDDTYEDFVAANEAFVSRMRQFIAGLRKGDERAMKAASERVKIAIGDAQNAILPLHE